MTPETIVLIGGGGHCASCIDVLESTGRWKIAGIVDPEFGKGSSILGYGIIGTDDDMPAFSALYGSALVTVGQIESAEIRDRLLQRARNAGFMLPVIVASTATVSRHARIGEGTIVMHHSFVNARAAIGSGCIINTGAIIEHDAEIYDLCHVSTGAVVNGGCLIGRGAFIGSRAVLRNNITICPEAVIGAGAVVVNDIWEAGTYAGNPARKL